MNSIQYFRQLIIILLLINITIEIQGQNHQPKLDSLHKIEKSATLSHQVITLDQISRIFWTINPDSSLFYSNRALEIALKMNVDSLLGEAYNSMGNAYYKNKNFEKAIEYYLKAKQYREQEANFVKLWQTISNISIVYEDLGLMSESISYLIMLDEITEEIDDPLLQGRSLLYIAKRFQVVNNSKKSIEFALKALNKFLTASSSLNIARAYNLIGEVNQDLENRTLAISYFEKAFEIYSQENNLLGIEITTNNLGIEYDKLNDNSRALEQYTKAFQSVEKRGDNKAVAICLHNIGLLYAKMKDYKRALEYYDRSLSLIHLENDYDTEKNFLNNMARTYYHLGYYNKAQNIVNESIALEEEGSNLFFKSESRELLGMILYKQNSFKEAYDYFSQFLILKDSLFRIESNKKIVEMQIGFEVNQKDKEIELLKNNDILKTQKISKQKSIIKLWIALTVSCIILTVLVLINLGFKKKLSLALNEKNKILEESLIKLKESKANLKKVNVEKDKLFSIIAHDLKNYINSLVILSEVISKESKHYSNNNFQKFVLLNNVTVERLSEFLQNLLDWVKSQLGTLTFKPETFNLKSLIDNELSRFESQLQNKNIEVIVSQDSSFIVHSDKNLISVIIRNLLSNALKYSYLNSTILIESTKKSDSFELSVIDNGTGMTQNQINKLFIIDNLTSSKGTNNEVGTGLGLLICKELIEKCSGKITITSEKDKGSKFTVIIPSI
jgi:signal transduction histidine kinase